jgi:anti-sigma factor RsiW
VTPDARHLDERIDDWIDGRLSADERREAEAHLAACSHCRGLRDALLAARDALRDAHPEPPLPAGFEQRLRAALDREDREPTTPESPPAGRRRRWRATAWPLAAGLAAAALIAVVVWLRAGGGRVADPVGDAFAAYRQVTTAGLSADLAAADAATVEARWRRGGITFPARVFDLGGMGIQLVGGNATRLGGAVAARSVYRGPNGLFLCWMFEGSAAALPPPAEQRDHGGFAFRIYRRGDATLVVWQEGEVTCAFAGSGDPESVVALAFAKAMAPRAPAGV